MIQSCLCRRPSNEGRDNNGKASAAGKDKSDNSDTNNGNNDVIVETVLDDEDTENLLPPTADTMERAHLPPPSGVVYMFPRAWKERTTGGAAHGNRNTLGADGSTDAEHCQNQSSTSSSGCAIS